MVEAPNLTTEKSQLFPASPSPLPHKLSWWEKADPKSKSYLLSSPSLVNQPTVRQLNNGVLTTDKEGRDYAK